MSEQVQAIVAAARRLSAEEWQELYAALASVERAQFTDKADLVRSIRGKYKHVPLSVDEFLAWKREDLIRESGS